MNIELRPLKADDANKWLELQRETYKSYLEDCKNCEGHPAADTIDMIVARLGNPFCDHYFAYSDEKTVGGIRIIREIGTNEIADLFVLPEFQNLGFGKKIVKMTEMLYPGVTGWKLWTELQSPRNHYFYEKLGYAKTEETLIINDKATLVLFRKQ